MGVGRFSASFDDFDATVVADEQGVRVDGSVRVESVSIKQPDFRAHVVSGADLRAVPSDRSARPGRAEQPTCTRSRVGTRYHVRPESGCLIETDSTRTLPSTRTPCSSATTVASKSSNEALNLPTPCAGR